MTTLSLSNADAATLRADVVVVGVHSGPGGPTLAAGATLVDEALGGRLSGALSALQVTGKAGETATLPTYGATAAAVVVTVGLGEASGSGDDAEALRRAAGVGVRAAAGQQRVAVALPVAGRESLRAVCEGAMLGAYAFDRYRTTSLDASSTPVSAITVLSGERKTKPVARRAEAVARAVTLTRDLVNMPPSDLHPADLAAAALAAMPAGVEADVLDEKALKRGGYGGILGVGAGAAHPPRLVHLRYAPGKAGTTLALVGKGITYDSGGLSLKPAAGMEDMKSDMAGGAAVLAATAAIAGLRLPIRIDAWVPMAENMPSGSAIRPSDVLSMYGGKRVEVLNTDAEGRLILGDALARASEEKPDYLVDVATLTGAQLVALGARTAAVMSNDDAFRDRVLLAAERAGEAMWPMPLPVELRKSLDSEIADLSNMGDRYGGMLVAGLFLLEFVGDGIPWAHLDIAGPSFNTGDPYGYTPKGGTGAAVRTLVELAESLAGG
ncbi:MAG: leucyl aminopeptidase [Frankiaceae bacterium]